MANLEEERRHPNKNQKDTVRKITTRLSKSANLIHSVQEKSKMEITPNSEHSMHGRKNSSKPRKLIHNAQDKSKKCNIFEITPNGDEHIIRGRKYSSRDVVSEIQYLLLKVLVFELFPNVKEYR